VTHPFDKRYFHGGSSVGGYTGYRDFPQHWITYDHVMKREPASVLELGCGRGYLLKRFVDYAAISASGIEISEHCFLTRALDGIHRHDAAEAPWPVGDQQFDLCLSVAFLEHVPEDRLPAVFSEMARTTRRGLHGIDIHDDGNDATHCTIRPLEWWKDRLPPGHEAIDKEDLERGPFSLPAGIDDGVKLNLGSFTHMFHGWRNIDHIDLSSWAKTQGYSFMPWDLSRPLPYDDRVVDLIFMSHVLEHFTYSAGHDLLRECRRVLKPDGLIRIAVPDADKLVDLYRGKRLRTLEQLADVDEASDCRLLFEFLAGGDHRAFYDAPELIKMFGAAGFSRSWPSCFRTSHSAVMLRETIDQYPDLSLFAEAQP
jgi:predicted SAM-dependent methyltransferase